LIAFLALLSLFALLELKDLSRNYFLIIFFTRFDNLSINKLTFSLIRRYHVTVNVKPDVHIEHYVLYRMHIW